MTNDTRTVPAEKVEEVISNIDRNLQEFSPEVIRALLAIREDIAAILPPPPIVIEPGRRYRTEDGFLAIGLDGNAAAVEDRGGDWSIINYARGGRAYGVNRGLDIIAPWEDAVDA